MDIRQHKIYAYITVLLFFMLVSGFSSCKKEEKQEDASAEIKSIFDSVNNLLQTNDLKNVPKFMDLSFKRLKVKSEVDHWYKYTFLADYYINYKNDNPKANIYIDSAFALLEGKAQQYKNLYAKTLFIKGDILANSQRYLDAFKVYYEGRVFVRNYLDPCDHYLFSYKLGMVKYNQKLYAEAIPYFQEALNEMRICNKKTNNLDRQLVYPQASYNAIGLSYLYAHQLDSAKHYFNLGLKYIADNEQDFPEKFAYISSCKSLIYANTAKVYLKEHNSLKAKTYILKSLSLDETNETPVQVNLATRLMLAEVAVQNKEWNVAQDVLTSVGQKFPDTAAMSIALNDVYFTWLQLNYKVYSAKKNLPQALNYLQQYNNMLKARANTGYVAEGLNLETVFKDQKAIYDSMLMNKELKFRKTLLIMAGVFIILVLCFLWYVLKNLKKHKALNKQITSQNQHLSNVLKSLEHSQLENTNILKVVAHDLRNPIGAISTISGLLLRNQEREEQDIKLLNLVQKSSMNALDLVNNLLLINSNIEAEDKELIDLQALINYCIAQLTYKAETKQQTIDFHSQPLFLEINREKIWRVFSNIITNAIKFSPMHAHIQILLSQTEHGALFSVKDAGIGIPETLKEKVFDMFSEARRKGTDGESTFGMGLSICKQIVEAHEGKIWFDTNPEGVGITFYVFLPKA